MTVSSAALTTVSAPAPTGDLGGRLRYYRECAGLSREHAAVHSGRSAGAIRDWELNQRVPNNVQLARLAQLYGVTVTELTATTEVSR